jgi:hypothetical protein
MNSWTFSTLTDEIVSRLRQHSSFQPEWKLTTSVQSFSADIDVDLRIEPDVSCAQIVGIDIIGWSWRDHLTVSVGNSHFPPSQMGWYNFDLMMVRFFEVANTRMPEVVRMHNHTSGERELVRRLAASLPGTPEFRLTTHDSCIMLPDGTSLTLGRPDENGRRHLCIEVDHLPNERLASFFAAAGEMSRTLNPPGE